MIIQLNPDESRALLRENTLARLGCVAEGEPYVVPVHYLFEGDSIYVHSLPGRKITALRANPRACLQVDETRNEFQWWSVIASGSYEEITDPDERERVLSRLFAHLPHFTPVESAMSQADGLPETIVFRIRISTITGVSETWP
ncbi:MAG TPA: pyridoxamine 5'-phosphate oxidase family protein [Blastocatellia bacterium]|nr:pyridoxamine 5'-phosphate oxidase family protein [Blastocatellia bacterium]